MVELICPLSIQAPLEAVRFELGCLLRLKCEVQSNIRTRASLILMLMLFYAAPCRQPMTRGSMGRKRLGNRCSEGGGEDGDGSVTATLWGPCAGIWMSDIGMLGPPGNARIGSKHGTAPLAEAAPILVKILANAIAFVECDM